MKRLMARMPPGYQIQIAGAVEESSKGQGAIAAGVPVMLFIIFTLLMLQLHSSRARSSSPHRSDGRPPARRGALLVLNRPFGFVALLGVIALMGMIMRNSVILTIRSSRIAPRRAGVERDHRVRRASLPTDRADGVRGRAGDDPAVGERVLGADGRRHQWAA